jgi:futalosine hydrolase
MILALAATEFEMKALLQHQDWDAEMCETFVTGVGPLETAVRLTRFLQETKKSFSAVIEFGIAGSYLLPGSQKTVSLLDICLAENEVFGDFGICYGNEMENLSLELTGPSCYMMDASLNALAEVTFKEHDIPFSTGNFVTVSGVSGTRKRGEVLREKHNGLCENMEGAAVARVCQEFSLPLAEIRSISNYVEDRNLAAWKLKEACLEAGRATSFVITDLLESL